MGKLGKDTPDFYLNEYLQEYIDCQGGNRLSVVAFDSSQIYVLLNFIIVRFDNC